jgi:hypothetical protein
VQYHNYVVGVLTAKDGNVPSKSSQKGLKLKKGESGQIIIVCAKPLLNIALQF